jgi:large subunit ribosomal protein L24
MKIKKNDKVKILAGKDKGKTGKVLQVFAGKNTASVEGLNLLIKHMRPHRQGEKGQRIEFPAPLNMSNLALICPSCGRPTKIGYQYKEIQKGEDSKTKKYRICKKCKQVVD